MNNDLRNLSKWLNEEQETPIDRQALARVLAMADQQAQGCDYCNHPQYAGTKCKNCGREQPAQRKPLTDELNQIEKDLSFHGLTLVKTATGYAVLKLGQITANAKGDA